MEIGWDSLKADAYTACDSNSVPTSKVSHIWYENVGIYILLWLIYILSPHFCLPLLALVRAGIGCPTTLHDPCL